MKKIFWGILVVAVLLGLVASVLNWFSGGGGRVGASDYRNAEYLIGGEKIQLENGRAEREISPQAASQEVTQIFGNELLADLNGDGREDIAFIITQNGGGTGTFFYAVAALNMEKGFVGSDGYFLGDRIAPQSTNMSQNPVHKNVVVFNYADRAPQEPMVAQPSIGKSAYLKLDEKTMRWGVVVPDFEGESR